MEILFFLLLLIAVLNAVTVYMLGRLIRVFRPHKNNKTSGSAPKVDHEL